ncbi:hypothetical protein SDC9_28487 [bioreactor metagenome]|uniref:Uncharacterized protein n=1 Tax=bioreactor metagenome TaxID=1076179 RepID=A0A644UUQ8_9ZZZZ
MVVRLPRKRVDSAGISARYLTWCLVLANKVGGIPRLRGWGCHARGLASGDALEQPCHVVPKGAHDLQAFLVLHYLLRRIAVHGVPVLGRNHGHARNGKVFVQPIKGSAGPATAAAHHGGGGLEGIVEGLAIEHAVKKGAHAAVGAGVVNRRTHNKAVCLAQQVNGLVNVVCIEHAMPGILALAAANTALYGLCAQLEHLRFNAVFFQLRRNRGQGGKGTALGMRAAVEHEYLHENLLSGAKFPPRCERSGEAGAPYDFVGKKPARC